MTRFTDIAHWRPLGPGNPPSRMDRHDIICLHTMVGYLKSTEDMFDNQGYTGVESHFGVGGKWGSDASAGLDGIIYQWVDTEYRADANLDGNHRLISIETADNAPQRAADIQAWTPNQVRAIIRLVAALCRRYDIPAQLVPDSKPGRRGIAYHRQGIDPWRVAGGEVWSNSRGKECPGDRRIAQIRNEIIPGVRAALAPKVEDIIMDDKTAKEIRAIIREELTRPATIETIAEGLFTADVIEAPDDDKAADPKNPTWQLRSYLNRLVNNTKKAPPTA
jgi:N-acetylmuramoyl-L-alanine amidase-like protein